MDKITENSTEAVNERHQRHWRKFRWRALRRERIDWTHHAKKKEQRKKNEQNNQEAKTGVNQIKWSQYTGIIYINTTGSCDHIDRAIEQHQINDIKLSITVDVQNIYIYGVCMKSLPMMREVVIAKSGMDVG